MLLDIVFFSNLLTSYFEKIVYFISLLHRILTCTRSLVYLKHDLSRSSLQLTHNNKLSFSISIRELIRISLSELSTDENLQRWNLNQHRDLHRGAPSPPVRHRHRCSRRLSPNVCLI